MPTVVAASAPGKVNLFLGCGMPREDGYHELVTVFQAINLTETVTLTATGEWTRDPGRVVAGMEVTGMDAAAVPTDETNLAHRALVVLAGRLIADAGELPVVSVGIEKGIPTAGGMAGGSADAAAALRAGNEIFGRRLSDEQLYRDVAVHLGADVPFTFFGGTMLGTGRGDELTRMLSRGRYHWVFATFRRGLSTPEVFRTVDAMPGRRPRLDPTAVAEALGAGDARALAAALHNDLEAATLRLRPDVGRAVRVAGELGALRAVVSGSGPTVAFLCADEDAAGVVAEGLIDAALCHRALIATGPAAGGAQLLTN